MFYWRWLSRPRHPLLRAIFALVGAVLLVGIFVFGFFALIAFAFIGSVVAITRAVARAHASTQHPNPQPAGADPRVIEGEYVVLRDSTANR
jgi:hypothetical protein